MTLVIASSGRDLTTSQSVREQPSEVDVPTGRRRGLRLRDVGYLLKVAQRSGWQGSTAQERGFHAGCPALKRSRREEGCSAHTGLAASERGVHRSS